jgi:hypothetical protein
MDLCKELRGSRYFGPIAKNSKMEDMGLQSHSLTSSLSRQDRYNSSENEYAISDS